VTDHKKKGDFDKARKHDTGGNKKSHAHAHNSRTSGKQNAGHGGHH
jgi:hypothetical protein